MELTEKMMELEEEKELMPTTEVSLENERNYDRNLVEDNLIENLSKKVEKNTNQEVQKQESLLKNVDKESIKTIIKNVVALALKMVLKNKFNVSFSTFEEAKKAVFSALDGDAKKAVKSASDAALSNVKGIDSSTKSIIKTIKNTVIDSTLDNSKYEITVRQAKVVNRMQENCTKLEEAFGKNDANMIKKVAKSLQKDMKEILPIQSTIQKVQIALDKYELWKNNGNRMLSQEENELIEKMNLSA